MEAISMGPGEERPRLAVAALPYFGSERNVCMSSSARRNLIYRRDKRNYALRFKSWWGVRALVSLQLMDVNVSLSSLDPIIPTCQRQEGRRVGRTSEPQTGTSTTSSSPAFTLTREFTRRSSAPSHVRHCENIRSTVQSEATTKSWSRGQIFPGWLWTSWLTLNTKIHYIHTSM